MKLKQKGITLSSELIQNKIENKINQSKGQTTDVSSEFLTLQTTPGSKSSKPSNPVPVSRNNVVFKESNTEKLGVSMDMLKQLKGGIPTDQLTKKKKHTKQKEKILES